MRLHCISRYGSSLGEFAPGDVIDVDDVRGALLLRDSPGSFRDHEASPVSELVASVERADTGEVVAYARPQRKGAKR